MNFYLDDDSIPLVLVQMLRRAGHDVEQPAELGLQGEDDAVHLLHAIRVNRIFLSHNYDDFQNLHDLVIESGGRHPGILMVRRDGGSRDMAPAQVVRSIANFAASGLTIYNEFVILNQWR